jgi:hypothetical protein
MVTMRNFVAIKRRLHLRKKFFEEIKKIYNNNRNRSVEMCGGLYELRSEHIHTLSTPEKRITKRLAENCFTLTKLLI